MASFRAIQTGGKWDTTCEDVLQSKEQHHSFSRHGQNETGHLIQEKSAHAASSQGLPPMPKPPRSSRSERPRTGQRCRPTECASGGTMRVSLTVSVARDHCGTSPSQLTHEISSLVGPSPTDFATQHHQTRPTLDKWTLVSRLLQSCSIVVSTLATRTAVPSDGETPELHQLPVALRGRAANHQSQPQSSCYRSSLEEGRSRSATRTLTESRSPASGPLAQMHMQPAVHTILMASFRAIQTG